MTNPTTNQNETAPKTCGHPMPTGPDNPIDQMCAVCENCKLHMCDDCEVLSGICAGCGGSLCENCKVNARQRQKIEGNRSVTEYLCNGCVEKQDHARLALIRFVRESITGDEIDQDEPPRYNFGHPSAVWFSEVISDLEQAISEAKEAL